MKRIGVIGLGGIARKAYLPVIAARGDIELLFCTRNEAARKELAARYRPAGTAASVDELLDKGVDAAFVHAATEAHPVIVRQLLSAGVHVYLDKPIAYTYEEALELTQMAARSKVMLMTGFNRRFAPMYADLAKADNRRIISMQKNRTGQPDYARRFVFDDFIHVVDTIRHLAPGTVTKTSISVFQQEGKLYHAMLQLEGKGFICTGIMNRDSGGNEEKLEMMSPGRKWTVNGLNETILYQDKSESRITFNDWDTVLFRRGFEQIISHFIDCVQEGREPGISLEDALESHRLCEEIVKQAEAEGAAVWPFDRRTSV
ncbi:Gfo/Idh/MocA family protein [Paenibacillus caui]|uniref:Gfo/Idh/MocA family protein n=1 Tax=Paenibacillus caui TaxID=2873927 RepID=UPI001CA8D063|nr:Gfo/Idh/MocA family oxidoreductase [Paenibacillus caui]